MSERTELLRKHAEMEHAVRDAEVRADKLPAFSDARVQAQVELEELRVQLGQLEWQLQNRFRVP